jgi:hypothetical protein
LLNFTTKAPLRRSLAREIRRRCLQKAAAICPGSNVVTVRVLSETGVNQVYCVTFSNSRRVVIKRHENEFAFERELLALTMYEPLCHTPRLVAPPDHREKVIYLEYLPRCLPIRSRSIPILIAYILGRLHAFANRCATHAGILTGLSFPSLEHVPDGGSARVAHVIEDMVAALGPDYYPSAIGDMKSDHFRLGDGGCCLVDLETFRWGRLEVMDLAQLIDALPRPLQNPPGAASRLCTSYCEGRRSVYEWGVSPGRLGDWLAEVRAELCAAGEK